MIKTDLNKLDLGKLIGIKDLRPDEEVMYEEIISSGKESSPKRIKMFSPDKDKATLRLKMDRKKKSKKTKTKRKSKKKDCGCK